ncbi:hypothetical protein X801_03183 [Opisthorchis viverrini]|uniref:Uncharacterized protein n=2 Tax=Opisthorchis viverrini TaxID=6198 RepID=A0A074ZNY1_OPIVI|nr:hypothetical protein T265_07430 [Opisthorchis viverrini]KER25035.1 hypothetical protein T265_07430 [Opisthorchis viverrini]OON20925.1 hypothetical protein X801_03183 [Opisthorchis viverrini]
MVEKPGPADLFGHGITSIPLQQLVFDDKVEDCSDCARNRALASVAEPESFWNELQHQKLLS